MPILPSSMKVWTSLSHLHNGKGRKLCGGCGRARCPCVCGYVEALICSNEHGYARIKLVYYMLC